MIESKEYIAVAAILWETLSISVYMHAILRKGTKPHLFTWLIWGVAGCIVAAAQYVGQAGSGAWASLGCSVLCLVIALFCIKFGEKRITQSDWVMLGLAFASLLLWLVTDEPLTAVLLLSFTDLMAYGPTFRKAYLRPHEENLATFALAIPKDYLLVLAVQNYSWTTAFYPASLALTDTLFVLMLIIRRRVLHKT